MAARIDLRLQDARAGLAELSGPFDLAFLDGVKAEYEEYLNLVVPLLRPGGLVATITPVGDGIALAVRR